MVRFCFGFTRHPSLHSSRTVKLSRQGNERPALSQGEAETHAERSARLRTEKIMAADAARQNSSDDDSDDSVEAYSDGGAGDNRRQSPWQLNCQSAQPCFVPVTALRPRDCCGSVTTGNHFP